LFFYPFVASYILCCVFPPNLFTYNKEQHELPACLLTNLLLVHFLPSEPQHRLILYYTSICYNFVLVHKGRNNEVSMSRCCWLCHTISVFLSICFLIRFACCMDQ
jgi:hypothetical protein